MSRLAREYSRGEGFILTGENIDPIYARILNNWRAVEEFPLDSVAFEFLKNNTPSITAVLEHHPYELTSEVRISVQAKRNKIHTTIEAPTNIKISVANDGDKLVHRQAKSKLEHMLKPHFPLPRPTTPYLKRTSVEEGEEICLADDLSITYLGSHPDNVYGYGAALGLVQVVDEWKATILPTLSGVHVAEYPLQGIGIDCTDIKRGKATFGFYSL